MHVYCLSRSDFYCVCPCGHTTFVDPFILFALYLLLFNCFLNILLKIGVRYMCELAQFNDLVCR